MITFNYIITKYRGSKKPQVEAVIPIEEVLKTIKEGDSNLSLIEEARKIGKGNAGYDAIKTYKLPTVRFNFLYEDYAIDDNIIASTGLIYLDADSTDTIPESPYVFAKWKSLSNTGYGVLVKVDNLTKTNHRAVYDHLSELIGIKSDPGARKAIQQTVLSYDSNLYLNPDSITYTYIENELIKEEGIKKVSFSNIKKKKKGILSNETFLKTEDTDVFRSDNIDEYFTGEFADELFLFFSDEKVKICQPFIPYRNIEEGQRNWIMFSYLSNKASLNLHCDKEFLTKMSHFMNNKMNPKLPKHEVNTIIRNILKKRDEGSLEIYLNKERRILFNPNYKLSRKEQSAITAIEMGKMRTGKTAAKIYQIIESWDFEVHGKITIEKIAEIGVMGKSTVKTYYKKFKELKEYAKDLNTCFKAKNSS